MRMIRNLIAAVMIIAAAVVEAGEVSVAVAANFTNTSRDIVSLFEKATDHKVKASFGSTGKLFSQIHNGAPFEVYLAADSERPMKAEQMGLAVPGSHFVYARGRLVLWSPEAELFEQGESYLRRGAFFRAAIGNPKTAPYGLAARQVLEHLGLWEQLKRRLVQGESIAQTFQFVATGNAEVGFVAASQVRAWKGSAGSQWPVPEAYHEPIEQAAVLLRRGETNPAARAFIDFLNSGAARAVILRHGYGVE